ncbi:MAG: DUF4013 domain-containing protein [Anaerolineae bacterium]|nr:DUF4013 domain-containing protein [Anaerolineae bacterium]
MEFGSAFSLPFKDSDWFKKMILNGLIMLIPVIGGMVLFGWALEIARRTLKDEPYPPLPDLDFGGQLAKGFQGFIISLVYALPIIILSIPIQIVPFLGSALELDADTLNYAVIAVSVCCGGINLIYAILMGFMLPAALGRFLDLGSMGAAFKIGEVFSLVRAAPVAFLLVIIGNLVAGIISSLGTIVCIVGVLITAPFAMAIMGNLYGQAYKQAALAKR